MSQAVTQVQAFGFEKDESLTYRFSQRLILWTTGLNTDTVYDFGNNVAGSLGTFWTAALANGTYGSIATTALQLIQTIQPLAQQFLQFIGPVAASYVKVGGGSVQSLTSANIASSATPTATVTGLLATDVILSVTQSTANTNSLTPIAFGTPSANALPLTYSGACGTGGQVTVTFFRPTGTVTPQGSQYTLALQSNLSPNLTFASGYAPTAGVFYLDYDLANGTHPVYYPTP
jgi:hypothetical protein